MRLEGQHDGLNAGTVTTNLIKQSTMQVKHRTFLYLEQIQVAVMPNKPCIAPVAMVKRFA